MKQPQIKSKATYSKHKIFSPQHSGRWNYWQTSFRNCSTLLSHQWQTRTHIPQGPKPMQTSIGQRNSVPAMAKAHSPWHREEKLVGKTKWTECEIKWQSTNETSNQSNQNHYQLFQVWYYLHNWSCWMDIQHMVWTPVITLHCSSQIHAIHKTEVGLLGMFTAFWLPAAT